SAERRAEGRQLLRGNRWREVRRDDEPVGCHDEPTPHARKLPELAQDLPVLLCALRLRRRAEVEWLAGFEARLADGYASISHRIPSRLAFCQPTGAPA